MQEFGKFLFAWAAVQDLGSSCSRRPVEPLSPTETYGVVGTTKHYASPRKEFELGVWVILHLPPAKTGTPQILLAACAEQAGTRVTETHLHGRAIQTVFRVLYR